MRTLTSVLLSSAVLLSCGGGGGDDMLGELDPRCEALCSHDDDACADDVTQCQQLCQVRIAGVESLCASCLLEDAHLDACGNGGPCCPDPEFETSALDCATSCAGSAGVNPAGGHPVCVAVCSDDDPACVEDAATCMAECQARVDGVSGLCATCLLEGAGSSPCNAGGPCCPDIRFWNTATDCAAVCASSEQG